SANNCEMDIEDLEKETNDHGDLKMTRLQNQKPIIIIPRGEMDYVQEIPPEYDIIKLHFPTVSVKYKSNIKDQFIQEIRNALSNPDNNEKTTGLREKFNEWDSFTVTDVIIGGAIMIKIGQRLVMKTNHV
ncbi:26135_t:CDS:2, partial [Gigaspora rosea]